MIKKDMTIVFQGDSITDAGRRDDPNEEGYGFAGITMRALKNMYPDYNLTLINKGLSGSKSRDVRGRWETECLNYKPDIIVLLVGVNDCWHGMDNPADTVPLEAFQGNVEYLMKSAKDSGAKLVVIEPFIMTHEVPNLTWLPVMAPMMFEYNKLAIKYADKFIGANSLFAKWCVKYGPYEISEDGVHPNLFSHMLLAQEVIKELTEL